MPDLRAGIKELNKGFMEVASRESRNHKCLTEDGRTDREKFEGAEANGRKETYLQVVWRLGRLLEAEGKGQDA